MTLGSTFFFAGRVLGLSLRGQKGGRGGSSDAPARRYLRGAIVSVALSIVPLVLVLLVADGMIEGITARYIETGTYHLQAQSLVAIDQAGLESAAEIARAQTGVRAFPELQSYGVAIAGSRTAGVALRAVDPAFLQDPGTRVYLTLGGGEMSLESTNQILLGEPLAKELGVKPGDSISVLTERPGYGGAGGQFIPKISVFRVRGIVSAGYRELDALWAFISLRAGARILWEGDTRAMIGIKVANPFGPLEPSRARLKSALGSDWKIVTWPEAERNVFKSFATTRALLLLVMALAVAVAAINVGSALVMLVLERRRDIAILKSAGAAPAMIGRSFVLTGLAIGGLGTLLGIAAGSLLAWGINDVIAALEWLINGFSTLWAAISGSGQRAVPIRLLDPSYYLERIPIRINLGELGAVLGLSLALCLLASLIPARRASRLPPLEILRKT